MNAKAFFAGLAVVLVVAAGVVAWSGRGAGDAAHGALGERAETPLESTQLDDRAERPGAAIVPDSRADETSRTAVSADAVAARSDERAMLVAAFVSAETGAPLAGQRCSVRRDGGGFGGARIDASEGGLGVTPRSGDDGVVRFRLPPGSYAVHPDDDGVEPQDARDLAAGEVRRLTFVVRTRCDLVALVLVLDEESERPLPELELRLRGLPKGLADPTRTARTDAAGRAAFHVPSWLPVLGEIEAEGFGPARFRLLATHDSPEAALVVRLARAATLRGRVTDESDNAVSDVTIELACSVADLGARDTGLGSAVGGHPRFVVSERKWSATTARNGRFEIAGLPPDVRLEVVLHAPEREIAEETLRLSPGEVRDVDYRIGAGALLRGVLVDADGQPLPEVVLTRIPGAKSGLINAFGGRSGSARTELDGTFEMRDVPPGDWLLGPIEPRGTASWMTHVAVPEGVPTLDVVLRRPRSLAIRGRVVDPNGDGVSGIHLLAIGGGAFVDGRSGDDGAFDLGPVAEGEVTIEARTASNGWIGANPVQARAGDQGVLVPVVACGELLVRVRDENGRPVAAEIVRSRIDGAAMDGIAHAATDANGELTLSHLAPGLHRVIARVEGGSVGAAEPVRIEPAGRTSVDVTVRAGGRLRLRLPDEEGATEPKLVRMIVGGMYTEIEPAAAGGEFTSKPLPAGPAQVELVRADGTSDVREATVIAGETVDVAFD